MRLRPVYKEKVWSGSQISALRKNAPAVNIGESWDITCRSDCDSIIENGYFAGRSFRHIVGKYSNEMLGDNITAETFPILIKLIGTGASLSVQVHPDDVYAAAVENCTGKTEMWYVMDAAPDAYLVAGLKKITKEQLRQSIAENRTEEYLNRLSVKQGDYLLIPSGMVHALGPGCFVAEIQQNSDITYRIYDYGRDRKLHITQAMDVVDLDVQPELYSVKTIKERNQAVTICKTRYFCIDRINVSDWFEIPYYDRCFRTLTCTDGTGCITDGTISERFYKGDSLFLPKNLQGYHLEGKCGVLLTTPVRTE